MAETMAIGMAVGMAATLVMDAINVLVARTGAVLRIDHRMIGRMTGGWLRGRFRHGAPAEVPSFRGDLAWGWAAHYLIGGVLAVALLIGWEAWIGGPVSAGGAILWGILTTAAAWFLLLPSLGLGVCGLRSPHGLRHPLSSFLNHLFYGLGLAAAIALLPR